MYRHAKLWLIRQCNELYKLIRHVIKVNYLVVCRLFDNTVVRFNISMCRIH